MEMQKFAILNVNVKTTRHRQNRKHIIKVRVKNIFKDKQVKGILMGIKKVKLDYRSVAVRQSNEIAYEVSSDHVNAVNGSISRKVQRNEAEKMRAEMLQLDM